MELLNTIVWFLVALIVLVTVHEFGHFYVARLCGVKVLRFSVGFGTPLLKWKDKHGTEFVLAGIPLGGYVKMLDEREGDVPEEEAHLSHNSKNVWQRIAIAAAGPVVNFILAILLFWVLFIPGKADLVPIVGEVKPGSIAEEANLVTGQEIIAIDGNATPTQRDVMMQLMDRLGETGTLHFTVQYPNGSSSELRYRSDAQLNGWLKGAEEPNPLEGIGLSFQNPPVEMGEILPDGPAAAAGFQSGDRILFADETKITSWGRWVEYIQTHPEQPIDVLINREGREQSIVVTPHTVVDEATGKTLGKIEAGGRFPEEFVRRFEYSTFGALVAATEETKDAVKFILKSIKKLIFGEISTKNLSGPITIAKVAGSTANDGWIYFVQFLAWLSVSLGVFNLMPIPVLDGGHILYYLVEAIKGSPVSEKVQIIGYQVGLFMMVGVMILALYNDILRL